MGEGYFLQGGWMNESNSSIDISGLPLTGLDMVLGIWTPGIICIIGIIGNGVSLLVLSADRSRSPSILTLQALAVSDLVLLGSAFLQQVVPLFFYLSGCTSSLCQYLGYVRVYTWPVVCTAQTNTIWLTILISAERYFAICKPIESFTDGYRLRRVKWAVLVIFFTSLAFNIPKFFEFNARVKSQHELLNVTLTVIEGTPLRQNLAYRYGYNTALYSVVMYAFPITSLAFFNLYVVRSMRSAQRRWNTLHRTLKREMKATYLPLCIVLIFLITGTLSFIIFVLDAVIVDFRNHFLQIFTAVVNNFVVLNSAVDFVIFLAFGQKFRKLFLQLFLCQAGNSRANTDFRRPAMADY